MSASERPSPAALDLARATLRRVLGDAADVAQEIHDAVAANAPEALLADPALAGEIERSNAAVLLRWVEGALRTPEAAIEPLLDAETLDIVRDTARRGLEDNSLNYFRVGQGVAARHVLRAALRESDDVRLVGEVLDLLLRSSQDYVDRSVAALRAVGAEVARDRSTRLWGRRLEIVRAVLDGDLVDDAVAGSRLGFSLERPLLACVLWTDAARTVPIETFERLAGALAAAAGARRPLLVPAAVTSAWAWLAVERPLRDDALRAAAATVDGVRVAVGTVGRGTGGFRRGHLDALQAQRVAYRQEPPQPVVTHEEIRIAALAGGDEPAAREFVARTLGGLADAPSEVLETLRVVVACGFDTVAVAARLGVHRNTVLARVRRARTLLPVGSDARWTDVGLALELGRWVPPAGGDVPAAG